MKSKINSIINEVNWNILITSGKEIKRDSMISENKNRKASYYIYLVLSQKLNYDLNYIITIKNIDYN